MEKSLSTIFPYINIHYEVINKRAKVVGMTSGNGLATYYDDEDLIPTKWGIEQADQICYAVLCVFSYFAAGQEQKKAILEQAARITPAPPETSPSHRDSADTTQSRPSPQPSADKSPLDNRGSESRRSFKENITNVSIAAQRVPPDRQPRVLPEKPRVLPDETASVSSEQTSEQPTQRLTDQSRVPEQMVRHASEQRSAELTRVASDSRVSEQYKVTQEQSTLERTGTERLQQESEKRESPESGRVVAHRTESVPPRRPPPPALPPHRLTRAHSQASPPRTHDPPSIPPRVGAQGPRAGPPPALPPRQMSAAADLNTSPKSNSPVRRQGSTSAPFAPTNPFTAPRHAEFIIPQRGGRRPSQDLN